MAGQRRARWRPRAARLGPDEPNTQGRGRRRLVPIVAAMVAVLGFVGTTPQLTGSATATTLPATYDSQGPTSITNGQVENIPGGDPVAGAVTQVVTHPTDPNLVWIGTPNGGIWRTNNATAATPDWTPLTDQMPSLSISALELDPTVATNTVLVAGTGRTSSFNRIGGARVGLYRTTNAGGSWTQVGQADLAGENVSGVAPRGNTIVVSANGNTNAVNAGQGGIFRSTDGGATFTRLSGNGTSGLPGFGVFSLASDPTNNARIYAGGQDGIYRSDDTGATWTNVTNNVTGISTATTNNLELSVGNVGGTNVVFAGVINNGQLAGLWRSVDQGASWTQLDTPQTNEGGTIVGIQPREKPGSQGAVHFSILADISNSNVVYVGGDRQPTLNNSFPNSIGANDFSGRLFRCNASLAAGSQCAPITHNGTASNSSPHADSRDMEFDANGDIVEGDDGGVYRQTSPADNTGDWFSMNGDLQISESHSCDYDSVSNVVMCGNQDTGAPEQSTGGSDTWNTITAGDGGFIAIDDSGTDSIRFSSSNSLSTNSARRRTCDSSNSCSNSAPSFIVAGSGGQTIQTFDNLPLYTPVFLNKVAPAQLVVGGPTRVYESTDRLDNLTVVTNGPAGMTRAVAYGGRQNGADVPGVLWYGRGDGALMLRSSAGGTPVSVPGWGANGAPTDLVLEPEDWATAYVTNGASVFRTTDAGTTFDDVTGNLGTEAPGAQVWSLEVVPIAGTNERALVAGTSLGVFMTQTQNLGVWAELGALPNTHAYDIKYDVADDVLMIGTMGRGVWLLADASEATPVTNVSITKTASPDPVMAGEELFYTVTVTNEGTDTAVGVVVTDDLPDQVIYLSDNAGCAYDAVDHQLTCSIGDIPAGESRSFQIKTMVRSNAVEAETDGTILIENVATVGTVSVDDDASDNTAKAPTFVQDKADLEVAKVCKPDDKLPAGQTGHCTIFVDNLGPSSARDVVLRDVNTSDGEFTFGAITASQGTCDPPANGVVTCRLGVIPAASPSNGGRATVRIEVSATEEVDINDVADVTSATRDPNTANNQARDSISVMAVSDLAITKSGPTNDVAGTSASYVIDVVNNGPSTARGVIVEDVLPSGVTVVSVVASDGGTCNAGIPGNPAAPTTCSFGDLAPGATRTMTVDVRILPGTRGELQNNARVKSATFDDDLSNNLATLTTVVTGEADLSITKSDSPDPVVAGEHLTYTITVTNGGPSTAIAVKIADTLPAGLTFVSGEDGNGVGVCALVQSSTVVCDLGTMQPGEVEVVYLTAKVAPSVPDGSVSNTATVSSATTDPDPSDNSATATTAVITRADLWLDKIATMRSGNPAPVMVFDLIVHNDAGCETDAQSTVTPNCGTGGPSDAKDIVVTDQLPLDPKKFVVQYVSPQCTYTKDTHTVQCTSPKVGAGVVVHFVIEAQISGSVGTITNTASVTSATVDPDTANNTNTATFVVKGGTGKKK